MKASPWLTYFSASGEAAVILRLYFPSPSYSGSSPACSGATNEANNQAPNNAGTYRVTAFMISPVGWSVNRRQLLSRRRNPHGQFAAGSLEARNFSQSFHRSNSPKRGEARGRIK